MRKVRLPSRRDNLKLAAQDLTPGIRDGLIFSLTVFCLLLNSCATLKILPEERTLKDKYSRIYSMDFSSFHPKVNSALQEYAQKHKGNSFRVVRLGSDGVMIRGYFKSDKNQERFSAEMAVRPAGQKKTDLEIKLSAPNPKLASDFLEKAYQELFQIIEQGTGIAPQG
jgi:hypothetical protein